jgi:alpha/beta superfamily hydrolase
MELIIGVLLFGFAFGCIVGMALIGRHVEHECEKAYLTGHVDGYRKAQDDSREVHA